MARRLLVFAVFTGLVLGGGGPAFAGAPPVPAGDAEVAAWRRARSLDPFYARVAEDLRAGRPLVVAAFCGLWFVHEDDPERNLNWGTREAHWRLLERATRGRAPLGKRFRLTRWIRVYSASAAADPVRVAVYRAEATPDRRWRALGVERPFPVYLALLAYAEREQAGVAAVRALRLEEGPKLALEDGVTLDLGRDAQAVGYLGHNFFYDYPDFAYDGLAAVRGTPPRPKGFFAIACNTGLVPGFPQVVGPNVHVLLMTRSFMAVPGWPTLALVDGLSRAFASRELVDHADEAYRFYHHLYDPDERVGRPFVSHDHRLYPDSGAPARR